MKLDNNNKLLNLDIQSAKTVQFEGQIKGDTVTPRTRPSAQNFQQCSRDNEKISQEMQLCAY